MPRTAPIAKKAGAPPGQARVKTVQTTLKGAPPKDRDRPQPQKTPKSRQAEQPAQPKQENIREMVCKTLSEQLMIRLKDAKDLVLNEEEVSADSRLIRFRGFF